MVGPRTPEERLDDLEAERGQLRADLGAVQALAEAERGAREQLEAELRRGRLPVRPGRAPMDVQAALSAERIAAIDWLVDQRGRTRRN